MPAKDCGPEATLLERKISKHQGTPNQHSLSTQTGTNTFKGGHPSYYQLWRYLIPWPGAPRVISVCAHHRTREPYTRETLRERVCLAPGPESGLSLPFPFPSFFLPLLAFLYLALLFFSLGFILLLPFPLSSSNFTESPVSDCTLLSSPLLGAQPLHCFLAHVTAAAPKARI